MLVLSGFSHPQLAAALSKSLSAPLVHRTISRFSDQTFKIRINSNVKDKTVIIVQTLIRPVHDHLVELLLLADACKSADSKKIIAVIPYLAYSKQDQIFLSGEPLSARVIAQVLSSASIDEIIALDLHHDHIAKFFSVPIHNLSFLPALIHETNTVVAPDKGAVSRARTVAEKLSLPLITIDKHRDLVTGKVSIKGIGRRDLAAQQGLSLKDLKGKNCLIVDDLIVTGATLAAAAKFLKSRGAQTVSVFATHGLFTNGFQKLRSSGINSITVSDSIPHKNLPSWIKTISIVPTLTGTINNIINGYNGYNGLKGYNGCNS